MGLVNDACACITGQDSQHKVTVRWQQPRGFDQNYGAMATVMEFLSPIEQLKLQGLDKWQYKTGVSRVQVSFEKAKMFYLVDQRKPQILAVSETGEWQRFDCRGESNFSNDGWISCQVGHFRLFQIYFAGGSFRILKIDPSQRSFTVEQSGAVPELEQVSCLTNFKDQFIFNFHISEALKRYSLAEDRWEKLPPMKDSRPLSACSLKDKVYAFVYDQDNDKNLIHVLHNPGASISSQDLHWKVIDMPKNIFFAPRHGVTSVPLNSTEIAIFGGKDQLLSYHGDVITFNTSTCEFKKEKEDELIPFDYFENQSAKVCQNTIIALVTDQDYQTHLLKYRKGDNCVTILDH